MFVDDQVADLQILSRLNEHELAKEMIPLPVHNSFIADTIHLDTDYKDTDFSLLHPTYE